MDNLKQPWQFDCSEAKTIALKVATFSLGDVEDPDLLIAAPIYEWQQTKAGKWIMENSQPTPKWQRYADTLTYGHKYIITAYLTPQQVTYWKLKFE